MRFSTAVITLGTAASLCAPACSFRIDKTGGSNTNSTQANQARILGYDSLRTQVFAPHCISCHGSSGGVSLDTYAGALAALSRIENEVVIEQSMPPTGPLSPSDQQLVEAWVKAGGPEQDILAAPAPSPSPTASPVPSPSPAPPLPPPLPSPSPSGTPDPSPTPSSVTYAQVAAQVFAPSCVSCHNVNLAKAGVMLDSYANVMDNIQDVQQQALIRQSMPPSGPLSNPDQALLQAWIDAGEPQ